MQRIRFTAGWHMRPKFSSFAELAGGGFPWEPVTLPHDATLGRRRDPDHGGASGFFPGGAYEYSVTLTAPPEWRDQRVLLEFEGVYRSAMVYVNGSFAGQCASGYTGFVVPIDTHLHYGGDNEIRVECRSHQDSRWYAGAGIHRPVHLLLGPLLGVAPGGVQVTTLDADIDFALIEVATTLDNADRGLRTVVVRTELRDGDDIVATDMVPVSVLAGEPATVRQRLMVVRPALWGPDSPHLYTASVSVDSDGVVADEETVTFGIRTVQVDAQRGLRINGQRVLLRGACVHSDNGVLGAAAIDRADERRVQLLKEAGFNALRSAHNPMSRAMLSACDRLGVLVMDELTDVWTETKTDFDAALHFTQNWEHDIKSMVGKDFNHPSVIMYSIGNEIPELGKPHGALWSRRLAEKVRSLDHTRLVTNGVNGTLAVPLELPTELLGAGINTILANMGDFMNSFAASITVTDATAETFAVLDVAGMNYMNSRYEQDRDLFPHRVIVGSETFPKQIDVLWRQVLKNPHVIGDFTWAGWDYLGEAGIGRVATAGTPDAAQLAATYPWLTAWCADLDITGHRRPASYYREIVFGLRSAPYIAVQRPERRGQNLVATPWSWTDSIASWTWPGFEGHTVTVEVYSAGDVVELQLNGQIIGTAPVGESHRFTAQFDVTFHPGELTAVTYTGGTETARHSLHTAATPTRLKMRADRDFIQAKDTDLAFIFVELIDDDNQVAAGFDREVTITIEGNAHLQGFGSAAPATEESYLDSAHTTFDGRALAVIRPTGPGVVTVTSTAHGLRSASLRIHAQ